MAHNDVFKYVPSCNSHGTTVTVGSLLKVAFSPFLPGNDSLSSLFIQCASNLRQSWYVVAKIFISCGVQNRVKI
jgi:hypothetical protein